MSKINFFNKGKQQEAIFFLDKGIKLNQNNASIIFGKGISLHSLGNHEEAIVYFKKAICLDPNIEKAFSNQQLIKNILEKYE